MPKNAEYLFICLFSIYYVSTLMRCLFRSFVHFLIGLFLSLFLTFKILGVYFGYKSLLYMYISHIFSSSMAYSFMLLILFSQHKAFNFNKVVLIHPFLSRIILLLLHVKTHHQTQGYLDFLLSFLQKVLWFCSLCVCL